MGYKKAQGEEERGDFLIGWIRADGGNEPSPPRKESRVTERTGGVNCIAGSYCVKCHVKKGGRGMGLMGTNGLEKEEILLLGNFGHGVIITAWTWGFLAPNCVLCLAGLDQEVLFRNLELECRHGKGNMGSKRLGFRVSSTVDDSRVINAYFYVTLVKTRPSTPTCCMSRLKEEKTCKRKKQKIVLRSVRLVSPLYVYGNNGMGMTE